MAVDSSYTVTAPPWGEIGVTDSDVSELYLTKDTDVSPRTGEPHAVDEQHPAPHPATTDRPPGPPICTHTVQPESSEMHIAHPTSRHSQPNA